MKTLVNILFSICVIVVIAYLSFVIYAGNFFFYRGFAFITNNQTYSFSQMNICYFSIIFYLFNLKGSMNIQIDQKYIFDDYTLSHMLDVKNVFNGFLILFLISLLFLFIIYKIVRGKKMISHKFFRNFLLSLSVIFFSLFIFAILDFDQFFYYFHKIFFKGESWIFPMGSPIIQLLPLSFFYTLAFLIPSTFVALVTIFYLIFKKRQNKNHI